MARSKALQARQWWEECNPSLGARYMVQPNWLSRGQIKRSSNAEKVDAGRPTANTVSSDKFRDTAIYVTLHAERRMAQRNLSGEDVETVVLYGQTWHKAGAVIRYLRRKDLPQAARTDQHLQKLVGATVVMAEDERTIITAYRNRACGLSKIKRKPDYRWNIVPN